MAPQPLSKVVYSSTNFQIGPTAVTERPDTAMWIAQAIVNWSRVDATALHLFMALTGSNPEHAADLFSELESDRAKDAALYSVALASLSQPEHAVFIQHVKAIKTARKTRNKFAHWIFGVCDQVSDGLVGIDPKYLGKFAAKIVAEKATASNIDKNEVYVFKTSFVQRQAELFQELALATTMMTDMAQRKQKNERALRLVELSQFAHLQKA